MIRVIYLTKGSKTLVTVHMVHEKILCNANEVLVSGVAQYLQGVNSNKL